MDMFTMKEPVVSVNIAGFQRACRERGFTLIELLVTIVVLAILATVAAPNLTTLLDNRRLVGATEAVLAEIQFARSEAIKQSMDVYTLIYIDNSRDERWVVALAGRAVNGLDFAVNCDAWPGGTDPCALRLDGVDVERRVVGSDFRGVDMEVVAPAGASGADRGIRFDFVRGLSRRVDEGAVNAGWRYRLTSANGRQLEVRVNLLGRAWICETGPSQRYATC